MQPVIKQFEIWQSTGDCVATTVCPVGPTGDQCRSMLEPGAMRVFTYEATSEFEMMQRYYDYMGFGVYTSAWPELAMRPYSDGTLS
jgi:hypothetical protein